jgi:hypothetical protein
LADLRIHDKALDGQKVEFDNDKVAGEEKGLLINGNLVMTVSRHGKWAHVDAEYILHVAPGMDILLALGVAWIRADKQKQDDTVVIVA